jgi:hypothetical protein
VTPDHRLFLSRKEGLEVSRHAECREVPDNTVHFQAASDSVCQKGSLLTTSVAIQLATKALKNVKENAV